MTACGAASMGALLHHIYTTYIYNGDVRSLPARSLPLERLAKAAMAGLRGPALDALRQIERLFMDSLASGIPQKGLSGLGTGAKLLRGHACGPCCRVKFASRELSSFQDDTHGRHSHSPAGVDERRARFRISGVHL